ncbi:ABC transporter permease [Secundilactobacillus collinoides]|uniref:Transport permease protein n=2 Tax=Secundilactobacillus collinoides TaxID=33960 RepID=A0A0R2BHP5_SECCO|nr:ABC transporter permease [Secundilactobacillus collinoides]KRM75817.1 hypothetical protein FC82_GL001966 [Secundilactobacillus collinoides DSM 20515 = JCM 1123]
MIKQTWLFFTRRLIKSFQQPAMLFMTLMTPILYLVLFAPLLQRFSGSMADVLNQFVPGILILTAFSAGMGTGWYVVDDDTQDILELFKVMPINSFAYVLGTVIYDIIGFLVPAAILIIGAAWRGFTIHIEGLSVLLLLGTVFALAVSSLTAWVGLKIRNTGAVGGIVSGIQLPLMLLSGVMLPISYGPHWLRTIAQFNPMYYVVKGAQAFNQGTFDSKWGVSGFAVSLVLLLIGLLISTHSYRKLRI